MSGTIRTRLKGAGFVAAFVITVAVLGAVSRPSSTAVALTGPIIKGVPTAGWMWALAVAADDPKAVMLSTNDGMYRSADGGKTWQLAGLKGVNLTGLAQAGKATYAGGVRMKPNASPVIRKGTGRTVADGPGVLAVSSNGGLSWKELHPRGLPKTALQSVAVDTTNDGALYVLFNDGKLYKSTDSAGSFSLVTAKIGISPWAIAFTDGTFVGGDMDAGPHTSTDGKTWVHTKFTDGRGQQMVMEYAAQPGNESRILMTSIGVVMSTDGGKTWKGSLKSDTMFGPVAWAPSAPDVAYAVGFDSTIWRTDDAGKHWKQV